MLKRSSTAKIYYEDGKPFLKISPLFVEHIEALYLPDAELKKLK